MPTYEYECKSCGHVFEAFQGIKDDPLSVCPECGREIRRRINGGAGIIFKGSGFYSTDKSTGNHAAVIGPQKDKDREPEGKKDAGTVSPAAPESSPAASAPEPSSSGASGASAGAAQIPGRSPAPES